MMELPSAAELEAAARIVYRHMPPTPQYRWPVLCDELGADVWLKHENHTPVGAFKLRGGLVYFDQLAKVPGVIAATRGNHGQSVAYAAREYRMPATIVVPRGNSAEKNVAMRALGARLVEHGQDFQEAFEHAQALAQAERLHLVPSFDRRLVAGVGTAGVELLRAVPDVQTLYVPIGLGSGICAAIGARNALGARAEIVGVVSAHARAYAVSFAERRAVALPVSTRLADGMAVRKPDAAALEVIWRYVDRIVEVSDDELAQAITLIFQATHNVAEGAGAAGVAAMQKERSRIAGRTVAAVLSGGNIDRPLFAEVLAHER
jgi:threonine dehydratase